MAAWGEDHSTQTPIDEPLALSAPLALRLASTLCHTDPATSQGCAWYHGPWQLFRLMGLVMTPVQHSNFYRTALAAVARPGTIPRVLVSAAADYSILGHVLGTLRARKIDPEITVVDLCETPLVLNRWYAHRIAYPIQTCRRDIFEYGNSRPFDIICTHSFLGRFPPEQRARLVKKWYDLLRPGGAVITVNRIQPTASTERKSFSPEQARAFRDAVSRAAASLPLSTPIEPLELARQADLYTTHQHVYPVGTREDFVGLFERSGFTVEHISWAPIEAGARGDVSGPGVPGTSEYGRIIATRP
jgi:SAM-dependent methyltransferase